jgi:hypothetical protein
MGFFDQQLTPAELARSKYGRTWPTPVPPKATPKPPKLKEIIRKGPLALVWDRDHSDKGKE